MLLRIRIALAFAFFATPAVAEAHSLFGNRNPDRPLVDYLTLGFGHMVGGWDHLLFIAGVVLLAGSWRSAAKLISLFVAGHSLTLLVATIAGWKLDATVVDVVIALSLVYVGVQGIRGRPDSLKVFGAVVFAFGLVHGLGLSTRLQDLGLPDDGVVVRVILFNVGVEVGQLVALTVIAGIGTLLARRLRDRAATARFAFGTIAGVGLLAAVVMSLPDLEAAQEKKPVVAETRTACAQEDSTPPQFIGGDHPSKKFFDPGETAPEEDLIHVIGDGLVIVRYRPDIDPREVEQLEAFVEDPASREYVIAAPDPEQAEPLRAVAAVRTLSCGEVDLTGLARFRDDWFDYVQTQQGG